MSSAYAHLAALAAADHGLVTNADLRRAGVSTATRTRWLSSGLLRRLGPTTFAVGGAPPTWLQAVRAAEIESRGRGFVAGRTAARLFGLDGFTGDDVEVLVPRIHREIVVPARVASTTFDLDRGATVIVDGIRCLSAERLILDSPLFDFTAAETENAIDSALRLRLVAEQRLRARAISRHSRGVNGSRRLLDALVDTGGHSRLERWTLRIMRDAGLPRPELQRTYRDGTRIVARVDFQLAPGIVIEVAGHGTHSTRRQRRVDEQRRTELAVRGIRVVTFTYEDVRDRPDWVVAQLRLLLTASRLHAVG